MILELIEKIFMSPTDAQILQIINAIESLKPDTPIWQPWIGFIVPFLLGLLSSYFIDSHKNRKEKSKLIKETIADLNIISNDLTEIESMAVIRDKEPLYKLENVRSKTTLIYKTFFGMGIETDEIIAIDQYLSIVLRIVREYFTELDYLKYSNTDNEQNLNLALSRADNNLEAVPNITHINNMLKAYIKEMSNKYNLSNPNDLLDKVKKSPINRF